MTDGALAVPGNVSPPHPPPYSPGLDPAERLWARLRGRHLADRVYADYDELPHETDRA